MRSTLETHFPPHVGNAYFGNGSEKLLNFNSIRVALARDLQGSDIAKSSHWKFHTQSLKISSNNLVTGINGFSNRSHRFPGSTILHKRNLNLLFPWASEILDSVNFKSAVKICHLQSREVDTCVARHVFTFELLENTVDLTRDLVCIIGDGQANFVSLAIENNFSRKLISINLTEVLMSDLDLIEKIEGISPNEIAVAQTKLELEDFLNNAEQRLLLVSAQNVSILFESDIDLFVNMASFQEMNTSLIKVYFDVIKSNNAYLYCCNRVEKVLYGGEINRFSEFPWGDEKVLLDESCIWHQNYYSLRSPTLYKKLPFDGEVWHRMVKF